MKVKETNYFQTFLRMRLKRRRQLKARKNSVRSQGKLRNFFLGRKVATLSLYNWNFILFLMPPYFGCLYTYYCEDDGKFFSEFYFRSRRSLFLDIPWIPLRAYQGWCLVIWLGRFCSYSRYNFRVLSLRPMYLKIIAIISVCGQILSSSPVFFFWIFNFLADEIILFVVSRCYLLSMEIFRINFNLLCFSYTNVSDWWDRSWTLE